MYTRYKIMAQTWTDTPTLKQIKIGDNVYFLKDAAARAILDTYTALPTYTPTTDINSKGNTVATTETIKQYVDTQVGAIHKFDVTIYEKLPTASADTMYILGLVADKDAEAGTYIEYITIRSGSGDNYTYAWEQIGSTKTDLTDYVKKATKVAGIALDHDITVEELSAASALNLKALSHKDSATGSLSTVDSATVSFTPAGSVEVTATATTITSAGNYTPAGTVTGTATPSGDVTVSVTNESAAATLTTADYIPAGSVSVALSNATFNAVKSVGTAASFTEGKFTPATITYNNDSSFATEGVTATVDADAESLELTVATKASASVITAFNGGSKAADTFTPNETAQMEETTVGVQSAGFTGTKAENALVTGVSYSKASGATATFEGTASDITAKFAGTAATISVSGSYDKADASATFTGTAVKDQEVTLTKTAKTITVQ